MADESQDHAVKLAKAEAGLTVADRLRLSISAQNTLDESLVCHDPMPASIPFVVVGGGLAGLSVGGALDA
eukprot:18784-Prymnesium_polylepis.1